MHHINISSLYRGEKKYGEIKYKKEDYNIVFYHQNNKRLLLQCAPLEIQFLMTGNLIDLSDFNIISNKDREMLFLLYPECMPWMDRSIDTWVNFKFDFSYSQWLWVTPTEEFVWQHGVEV